ncbi:MAG: Mrp/NBP35 family ATP-binding protein [Planctomycetales bacterium]|nr:Mrp/NBP35 family ATP-binding protein [Planctomycetales bacterium]
MSNAPDNPSVLAALQALKDPESGRSVVTMEQVRDIKTTDNSIELTLALTTHSSPLHDDVREEARAILTDAFAGCSIQINDAIQERPAEKIGEIGLTAKSVIAVGSGKGGVGKSTIAASIAYGLAKSGCKVGLVDADVYGPSIPHLLGVNGRPAIIDNKIQPMEKDGLKVMSMGFLVPAEEAVVWRGPMLHGAITQFLRDTQWGDLDYLIIDMPPGTGDIALTLSQLLPLSGAVVVCTPQEVALLDAVKAIAMFNKVQIPVLGMVENMSGFICPDCDKRYDIFGSGGAKNKAAEMNIPFLGEVPINMQVRINGDSGKIGSVFEDPIAGPCVQQLTYNLAKSLAEKAKDDPPLPTLSVL